jgi:hypothetical protein
MSQFPNIRKCIDQIRPLLPAEFTLVVEYSGSNDSGWFDHHFFSMEEGDRVIYKSEDEKEAAHSIVQSFISDIHDELYQLLESRFPGWEIGDGYVDGSNGAFTIRSKNNVISQRHEIRFQETKDESPDEKVSF